MPVLVPPKNWVNWLSSSVQSAHSIKELIPQVPDELLVAHPVGVEVNNSRSQGKELIAPIGSLVATEDIYRINHEDFSFEEFSNE
jgi:putative SOS response-associated peptidase YedK